MVRSSVSPPAPGSVAAAAERLSGIANHTPVFTSRTVDRLTGNKVFFKCENFQRAGAFKFRGAYNAISRLSESQRAAGVITHSSGNHAQGLALAAKLLGVQALVVMPEDAPRIKREATADYGAEIIPCKAKDREKVTAELVAQHNYTLIHPYDNDDIIAGQGTAAWELFDEIGALDLLLVPVGGGGLISGSALAAALKCPSCRVVGVEPENAADANRSWREGRIYTLENVPDTVADGLRPRHIGQRNLQVMRQYVADMVTVTEQEILESLNFLWQRLKIVVEPSAAVALAPLLTGRFNSQSLRAGVLLSGGNVDIARWEHGVGARTQDLASHGSQGPGFSLREHELPILDSASPGRDRPRVLVCGQIDEAGLDLLRRSAVVDFAANRDEQTLQSTIGRYHALIADDATPISGQLIEYGYRLRVIGCTGTHLDNIDVSAARALGIEVKYSPGSNAIALAEHTISLMLKLNDLVADDGAEGDGTGLAGKTLGLIGFGRIGRQVAQRALSFDMHVLVNQPRLTPELALAIGVQVADLPELLRQADFVSLHVPFKAETDTLIGPNELALMKPSAFLINTAHTELIQDRALLEALEAGRLAGAALAWFTPKVKGGTVRPLAVLREHPRVIVARHITSFRRAEPERASVAVARQVLESLSARRPSEALALRIVPIDQVLPHEAVDKKRVARLVERLEAEGRLVNPPVVTYWKGRYIVLDGATRYTALRQLGFKYLIVQVISPNGRDFELHTWHHVISSSRPVVDLIAHLERIDQLSLSPIAAGDAQQAIADKMGLCYLLHRDGQTTLVQAGHGADRLEAMNRLVAAYTRWGKVERTLLTDMSRLSGQFADMVAVAVYQQFTSDVVFETAYNGGHLPAGLTRFVIPGRILRLNADLARLKLEEPLGAKRDWFNRFLEERLARSRLRYYQEPVVLLDE